LPVLPLLHVGAELLGELGDGLVEAGEQHAIAAGDRVGAESAIGCLQDADDLLHAQAAEVAASGRRDERLAQVDQQPALPHLVDAGGH
jgi:hypothetical protein